MTKLNDAIDKLNKHLAKPITKEYLRTKSKRADYVRNRHLVMAWMREHTDLSLPQIAATLKFKDHTTVLYGVRKMAKVRKTDALVDFYLSDGPSARVLYEQPIGPQLTWQDGEFRNGAGWRDAA